MTTTNVTSEVSVSLLLPQDIETKWHVKKKKTALLARSQQVGRWLSHSPPTPQKSISCIITVISDFDKENSGGIFLEKTDCRTLVTEINTILSASLKKIGINLWRIRWEQYFFTWGFPKKDKVLLILPPSI